jgi:hypothetical protein
MKDSRVPFEGFPKYKRSPRIIKRVQEEKIQLEKPKELMDRKKGGLVQIIYYKKRIRRLNSPELSLTACSQGTSINVNRQCYKKYLQDRHDQKQRCNKFIPSLKRDSHQTAFQ